MKKNLQCKKNKLSKKVVFFVLFFCCPLFGPNKDVHLSNLTFWAHGWCKPSTRSVSVPHAGFAAGDFRGRAGEGQERDLRGTVSLEIVIFLNTSFDHRYLMWEMGAGRGWGSISLSLICESCFNLFESIPECIVNLWKPHARREGAVRSNMFRVRRKMISVGLEGEGSCYVVFFLPSPYSAWIKK